VKALLHTVPVLFAEYSRRPITIQATYLEDEEFRLSFSGSLNAYTSTLGLEFALLFPEQSGKLSLVSK